MEKSDAIVLAAGRLPAATREHPVQTLKGLAYIEGRTPLQVMLAALRACGCADEVLVVGPVDASSAVSGFDRWVCERASGEENVLAGLRAARSRRVLLCASDLPFVRPQDIAGFCDLVPPDAGVAYPIFEKDEFLATFPRGRDKFASVGAKQWTGGSVCVVERELALCNEDLLRRAFQARRSQLAMASLLGPAALLKHLSGVLRVEDVTARLGALLRGKVFAIRGADPRLAMDCDSVTDIEYARSLVRAGAIDA